MDIDTLAKNKYISLTTFRKDGTPEATPVWLARNGDTLVVETTNFPEQQGFMGSWKHLKVTERFTRVSPSRLNYQFQIEDPDTWDKPWGGEYDFAPMHGIVYEYACHEGNYALPSILAGARRKEQEAAGVAAKSGGN